MVKKKSPEGLDGFKEVLDIVESKSFTSPTKSKDGYAVYSFLEQEQKRLDIIDDFMSKKYNNMKKYPQTEKLLINEVYKRNMLKDQLFEKMKYDDSPLNKHFEQIFNSAFK